MVSWSKRKCTSWGSTVGRTRPRRLPRTSLPPARHARAAGRAARCPSLNRMRRHCLSSPGIILSSSTRKDIFESNAGTHARMPRWCPTLRHAPRGTSASIGRETRSTLSAAVRITASPSARNPLGISFKRSSPTPRFHSVPTRCFSFNCGRRKNSSWESTLPRSSTLGNGCDCLTRKVSATASAWCTPRPKSSGSRTITPAPRRDCIRCIATNSSPLSRGRTTRGSKRVRLRPA